MCASAFVCMDSCVLCTYARVRDEVHFSLILFPTGVDFGRNDLTTLTQRTAAALLCVSNLCVQNVVICTYIMYATFVQQCSLEAEYAFRLHRPIVPLRVESKYRPDGWLGALIGNKLYFDIGYV